MAGLFLSVRAPEARLRVKRLWREVPPFLIPV